RKEDEIDGPRARVTQRPGQSREDRRAVLVEQTPDRAVLGDPSADEIHREPVRLDSGFLVDPVDLAKDLERPTDLARMDRERKLDLLEPVYNRLGRERPSRTLDHARRALAASP